MKRAVLIFVTLFFISSCATNKVVDLTHRNQKATALIQSSSTVMLKYVDNEEAKTGFIGQTQTYKVPAGQHTLMVEYSDLFEIDSDEHDKVVSRPAKVVFVAQPGKTYQVINPAQKTLSDAKEFAEKPDFYVVDIATGTNVQAAVELSRPRTFVTSLTSAVAPVYEFESDKRVNGHTAVSEQALKSEGGSHLKMLQSIWKNASVEERKTFMQWVLQN